ncbi:hypothetical protein HK405_011568, partial [Cladochytrium tenue]
MVDKPAPSETPAQSKRNRASPPESPPSPAPLSCSSGTQPAGVDRESSQRSPTPAAAEATGAFEMQPDANPTSSSLIEQRPAKSPRRSERQQRKRARLEMGTSAAAAGPDGRWRADDGQIIPAASSQLVLSSRRESSESDDSASSESPRIRDVFAGLEK